MGRIQPGSDVVLAQPARSDDGFVLVTVVGVLLILALIATSLLLSSRTLIKQRAATATRAELEAVTDGAVRFTTVRMAELDAAGNGDSRLAIDGTPFWCRDGDTLVRLQINDVGGLVDLNLASPEVLEILIAGLGTGRGEARAISAAIAAFRDAGRRPQPVSAERPSPGAGNRSFGPKNAPFDTVEELDQVEGMTPELLARLRPFLTVHNKSPAIDVAFAPLALLQALSVGARTEQQGGAGGALTDRAQFQVPRQVQTRSNPRVAARSRRRTFAVQAMATRGVEAAFMRRAVIEIAPQTETGVQVHEWLAPSLPMQAADALPASAGATNCF